MDKSSPEYHRYQLYLKSERWRNKKRRKLIKVGWKCEICKSRHNLECHHLTYERLYKERLSDLQILCIECHKQADIERQYNAGLNTFSVKKWGDNWQDFITVQQAKKEFDLWLKSKQ